MFGMLSIAYFALLRNREKYVEIQKPSPVNAPMKLTREASSPNPKSAVTV